ncbi:MAG: RNA polymerase sigma-70 factor (ECF subfamily) [Mariniblastus sp.]|jgi:RNA polymerase sigma-70 factor (ECF subfamily)
MNKEGKQQTSLTLLHRLKQNENEAWDRLVELYAPMIYGRYRNKWRFSEADSKSVGQDVFLAISRSIKNFERQRTGSFRKWLRVVIDSRGKNFVAKQRGPSAAGGSGNQNVLANVIDPLSQSITVDDTEQELSERCAIMRQALKSVENEFLTRDLQIFWDVIVEGKDCGDAAREKGVTTNVVYKALCKIKKRLRQVYEDLLDSDLLGPDEE